MNEVIEPLARTPGVLVAALVTDDGVPVAVPGKASGAGDPRGPWHDANVLAALAAAWVDDLERALGKLSWEAPRRAVLRAARGTLLVLPTSGALLVVLIERGLCPDELWLPMEGAAARIERLLRSMGKRFPRDEMMDENTADATPAPLPRAAGVSAGEQLPHEPTTGDREHPADR